MNSKEQFSTEVRPNLEQRYQKYQGENLAIVVIVTGRVEQQTASPSPLLEQSSSPSPPPVSLSHLPAILIRSHLHPSSMSSYAFCPPRFLPSRIPDLMDRTRASLSCPPGLLTGYRDVPPPTAPRPWTRTHTSVRPPSPPPPITSRRLLLAKRPLLSKRPLDTPNSPMQHFCWWLTRSHRPCAACSYPVTTPFLALSSLLRLL